MRSERLGAVGLRDERRLRARLTRAGRLPDDERAAALAGLERDLAAAEARAAARRAAVPPVTYPPDLPVTQRRADLLAAVRDHQVVVVAGETGSGKTTQLPKICLELGRGVRGMIGHTQPRRLAARTVAARVAEELGVPLGGPVGYAVRFTDRVGDTTLVKLMTDGILLAELPRDRDLLRYDTVIIDEAHERSLNVDFLLGYLRRLLPRRPDLKVVITSATIDPGRFAAHFGGAPVVEVSGRAYPVEVRYRPLVPDADGVAPDQVGAICAAVDELAAEPAGDVLVFLSGEREIRDTADALRALDLPRTEVLPLYARLPLAEQHRVFEPHTGRRIVVATNVAETSLTVPGVRYVVDPGTVRISRYSHRTKVQRLPIEPVSQASAQQRAGRCGRVAPGVCLRLYAEEDLLSRPAFTDPEILRTNLAAVLLQMAALGLGDLESFPFLDPPDRRGVADGLRLLHELGAIDEVPTGAPSGATRRLTPVGRLLARLPVDPRLGRILVAADAEGALAEALVVVAFLAVPDPRERPHDRRAAADQAHARFADPDSDAVAVLRLWEHLREQQRVLSSSQFRRLCRQEFLSHQRVREWQDVRGQLRAICREVGLTTNDSPAGRDQVHRALLAGLLSHVGRYDPERRDYLGARGTRFTLAPGTPLARRPPRWVVAAELVETHRLRARTVMRVDPAWVERLAAHLVHRAVGEPRWDADRAQVVADETVTLYGIPLVSGRTVGYARVDPVAAHEMFLRHALVEGDWATQHGFVAENARRLAAAAELEDRLRRRDLVVDDETLLAFFADRVPADVVSGAHFDRWWKRARRETPDLLTFPESLLRVAEPAPTTVAAYPDRTRQDDVLLPLSYRFEPGTAADGVTVDVPLAVLNRVRADELVAPVPGLRQELVTALVRALPKPLRRMFVPAPDTARAVLERLGPDPEVTLAAVARELSRLGAVTVPVDAFDLARVPGH
ncbi:MAG: ATP-dependent RNA helicase HrpA, partial [Actinomycetia bacterium]|nr:ATP-dependent RNA helicase HrpA [Actinomycetes bacterium]